MKYSGYVKTSNITIKPSKSRSIEVGLVEQSDQNSQNYITKYITSKVKAFILLLLKTKSLGKIFGGTELQ